MLDNGFLEERKLIREWLEVRENNSHILAESNDLINEVMEKMKEKRVSKVPVFEKDKPVGSVRESTLLKYLIENPNDLNQPISTIMEASFDVVDYDSTLDEVTSKIQNSWEPVLTKDRSGQYQIITTHDQIGRASYRERL